MKRALIVIGAVFALVTSVVVGVNAAPLMTAEPVPTCVKPTATNMTQAQQTNYIECRDNRLEALIRNGYEPAPTVTATATTTVTETVTASPTATPTQTATPSPTPTPTPPPTGVPTAADFPTPQSVGPKPLGTLPSEPYGGDCTFDPSESGTLIENKVVDCTSQSVRFLVGVTGVTFRNSIIRGGMFTVDQTLGDPGADTYPKAPIFTVEDSRIIQTDPVATDRAACCGHYVIKRSLIQGTHSALAGHNNVTLIGNYITTDGTDTHQSGMRVLKNAVIRDNTISCYPNGPGYEPSNCSGHGVFYREALGGEPVPAYNLTIDHNYFKRDPLGGPFAAMRFIDCASHTDCLDVDVTNNLFDPAESPPDSGEWPNYGGNLWTGNYYTNGTVANHG